MCTEPCALPAIQQSMSWISERPLSWVHCCIHFIFVHQNRKKKVFDLFSLREAHAAEKLGSPSIRKSQKKTSFWNFLTPLCVTLKKEKTEEREREREVEDDDDEMMMMKWWWNDDEMMMKWWWNDDEIMMKWWWNDDEMMMKWDDDDDHEMMIMRWWWFDDDDDKETTTEQYF